MKIWIIQTGEPLQIDGEYKRSMRAVNLTNYFLKKGHDVTLWSSAFSHKDKKHRTRNFKKEFINKKLKINLVPSPGYKYNIGIGRLFDHFVLGINFLRWVLKTPKNLLPEFVFIGYPPIEISFFMSLYFKLLRIPFCIDIKDQWPHIFIKNFSSSKKFLFKLFIYPYFLAARHSMQHANFLTSISPTFLEFFENFSKNFSPNNKVLYLLPDKINLDSNSFKDSYYWWEKEIGIDIKKRNKIIFAGSMINRSFEFDDLLFALNSQKIKNLDLEFVICGTGQDKNEIQKKFSSFKNVFFPGWVDLNHLITLKNLSLAYLAPYKNIDEYQMSIPNKIFDGLYFGLPIITGLKGEVENLIKKHKVGYFCETKVDWINNIRTCVKDMEERNKFSENGKNLFNSKFNPDIVYGNFVRFIEKNYK